MQQGAKGFQILEWRGPVCRSTGQDSIPEGNPGLAGDVPARVDLLGMRPVLSTVAVVDLLADGVLGFKMDAFDIAMDEPQVDVVRQNRPDSNILPDGVHKCGCRSSNVRPIRVSCICSSPTSSVSPSIVSAIHSSALFSGFGVISRIRVRISCVVPWLTSRSPGQ